MGEMEAELVMTWANMIARCYLESDRTYYKYGAKGIRVCERWHVFANFIHDMGQRPQGMTLDRINSAGPYAPENCRWATITQQNRNRSSNVRLTIGNESKLLVEWAECPGAAHERSISRRLKAGWTPWEAVFAEARGSVFGATLQLTIDGIDKTIHEWSMDSGISESTIRWRLRKDWNPKDAVFKAASNRKK